MLLAPEPDTPRGWLLISDIERQLLHHYSERDRVIRAMRRSLQHRHLLALGYIREQSLNIRELLKLRLRLRALLRLRMVPALRERGRENYVPETRGSRSSVHGMWFCPFGRYRRAMWLFENFSHLRHQVARAFFCLVRTDQFD
jgi:hypothetical protein